MSRAIVARAPTRIDFGGGWTDVPPYAADEGGAVCNMAIARYATATVAVDAHRGTRAGTRVASDDALIEAALRKSTLVGAEGSLANDFPIGAGLGGSSAAGVALAGALAVLADESIDPTVLAERSRATEVNGLGVAGGFQDHYAAAYGGALLLTFEDGVGVDQIALTPAIRDGLTRRVLLVYTGESRISGSTIEAVLGAYRARDQRVCEALTHMKGLARQMAAALRAGDLDGLGALVGEHWVHQRALHPSITTPRIEAIMAMGGASGAIGGKALGASGGGCVVLVAEDGREEELANALSPLGERLRYDVDERGFQIVAALTNGVES